MIISVDHGNKSIKTPNTLFTSGLIVSEGLQGFKTDYIGLVVPTFVPTVSSPVPAAVPAPLGAAVRSHGGSCRSAPGRTHPSSVPAPPAPPR